MIFKNKLQNIQNIANEYPKPFKVLMAASFIDNVGGALLFPFFSLYITAKFGVGMTTVGIIFGLFSAANIVGNTLGGALADRWGRKIMIIFGLIASAFTSLVMGFANEIQVFFVAAVFVGMFASVGQPAQQAMVADLLPERQHAEGYGVQRVVSNLAVVIGPAIGGLMAVRSYLLLFITDAVTSLIMAGIVLLTIAETKPQPQEHEEGETLLQTFGGYRFALRDKIFMVFIFASMLATLVYMQMNTTLAVYLRDSHGIPPQGYGYLLSMNAALVVLFQFSITRRLRHRSPLVMMTVGTLLYAIGFGMYGIVNHYSFFILAMVIITTGEMIVVPVSQALVAKLSPERMRGRYMAVAGLAWTVPSTVGPLLAGLIMDYSDPRWVWYASFILGVISAAMYLALHRFSSRQTLPEPTAGG